MKAQNCLRCKELKTIKDFSKSKNRMGFKPTCKKCEALTRKNKVFQRMSEGGCSRCLRKRDGEAKLCSICRAYDKALRTRLKLEAFNAYGGPICACCKETAIEFLSLDHVNGGGNAHRRQISQSAKYSGFMAGHKMYVWLKKQSYPAGFRVLCMNCNFALGHCGYCPHEQVNL
jgi:hypothetical protein